MAVRTPDPDPSEGNDDARGEVPRDPFRSFAGGFAESGGGPNPAWLTDVELTEARRRLPMLYVEALPVRTDGVGTVTQVGILLRATPLGEITRTLVSGR
ncbi:DUF4916 domain-containing protein, partial [Microbacterium sp. Leaf351]